MGLLKATRRKMASAHSSTTSPLIPDWFAVSKMQRLHFIVDVGKAIFGVWCKLAEGKRTVRSFPYVRCEEAGACKIAIEKPVVDRHC